jgi:translation initiation factor 2B subunit (eIF-2B alpha/beta/delta family)
VALVIEPLIGRLSFTLCASYKFLPMDAARLLRILKHPGDEVWPEPEPGVRVNNQYFEEIPLLLLRRIVSEQGVHTPETLGLLLQQRLLPPALLRLSVEGNIPE